MSHLDFAWELVERDDRIAAALATLRALEADVEELRTHAEAAVRFRAEQPSEAERLRVAAAEAYERLHAREAELGAAELALAGAKEGEPRAAAQRAVTRAQDAASTARRQLARLADEQDALAREAARVDEQVPRLEARTAELAARLRDAPRATAVDAAQALDAIPGWASAARASLFVAAGSLETERERVVREANELVAFALGEPTAATSVRLAAERIERAQSSERQR